MTKIIIHTISKSVMQILVAAMAFTVLFGNGLHLHLSIHDLFEHGNFHVVLHSHTSTDTDDIPGSGSEENESHQHTVLTIDFTGTITHQSLTSVFSFDVLQSGLQKVDESNSGFHRIERFALPPPKTIISHLTKTSTSLRAPPAA